MSTLIPLVPVVPTASAHVHPAELIAGISHRDIAGIKVVFINMPLRESALPNNAPEGPLLMATNLIKNYGVEATIVDLNHYRIKDAIAQERGLPNGRHLTDEEAFDLLRNHFLVYGPPDLIGMSGMITTLRWQKNVAKMVKKLAPNALLVSGNGLATELKMGLFNFIPELHAVAHSEGDDVIVKICYDAAVIKRHGWESAVERGELQPYYLGKIDGHHRLMYAGDRPRSDKKGVLPDSLPFADLSIIEQDVYGRPIRQDYMNVPEWGRSANNSSAVPWPDEDVTPKYNAVSSRGCPHECDYCFRGSQGERLWGVRSAQHLHREALHNIDKYGIKFIGYPDDNFAVAIPRIEAMVPLFKEFVAAGIHWGTHTRMDEGADARRIKPMADAGCVYIGFGPESAHPTTLKAINKGGQTLLQGFETVKVDGRLYEFPRSMTVSTRNCINYGIHANCTWIMGSPTETLENLQHTVAFMRWQELLYELHNIPAGAVNKRMFTMTWYPGTTLIKHPKVRGELNRVFGLNFDPHTAEPVCDENFYRYCLDLDDATKVLHGKDDEPLNFSEMGQETFLQVRQLIDSEKTLDILNL